MSVLAGKRTVALARLRREIHAAAREFQRLTELVAVISLRAASARGRSQIDPPPVVHPECAKQLGDSVKSSPCEVEWQKHIRFAERKKDTRVHMCPHGLRCAGVAILLGAELVGLGKLVCSPQVPKSQFQSFVIVLKALLNQPCQNFYASLLEGEVQTLQSAVELLRRSEESASGSEVGANLQSEKPRNNPLSAGNQDLISQILEYIDLHYTDRELSLVQVAQAVGRNEKYIAHLFTQQVGERMREYVNRLRVQHSCKLLLQTEQAIHQIARASGFGSAAQFRRSFRRAIGVTASRYRQIFTAGV
jgi:AraC-like DNA-binding protein